MPLPALPLDALLTGRARPFTRPGSRSGIAKSPRDGALRVTPVGLEGDEQGDLRVHGGVEKAIHHYPREHYAAWIAELGEHPLLMQAGAFGENFSTSGWSEADVCLGDRVRAGTALLEVSQGRMPCWKLNDRFEVAGMSLRVQESGRTGWYYRVLEEGVVAAGDILQLVERRHPDWSLLRLSEVLFDKALIPWEDVLVYRDLRRATGFYAESGFANLYNFQSGIRLGVKLELMIGLLSLGVRANGTQGFRGIQAALGELIALQHLLQALTTAMARDPERNAAGSAVPRLEYANALRIQVPQIWKRVRELLESALGGAPLVTVSGAADLRDGEARRLVDSYYRGAELEPEQRLKLFKLIWDATGSEFGARHAVYESHYSGNAEQIRLDSLAWASRRGHLAYCEAMVQRCMADYDIHGWLRGPWQHD